MAAEQSQHPENPERQTSKVTMTIMPEEHVETLPSLKQGFVIHFNNKIKKIPHDEYLQKAFSSEKKSADAERVKFWFQFLAINRGGGNISEEVENEIFISIDGFSEEEKRIKERFGNILRQLILEQKGFESLFFDLQVIAISYGSFDLAVGVTGVKKLAETFNNNIDMFVGFLEMYAPVALVHSLDFPYGHKHTLDCKIDVPKEFGAEFKGFPSNNSGKSEEDKKLKRFLTLVKFSWVAPLILSFGLLFVLYKEMSDAKLFYLNNYNYILQQQQELIKSQKEYIQTQSDIPKALPQKIVTIDSSKIK